jgi:uncharacterized membrane-anchored protein YjiN (DUF445 family)
MQHVEEKVIQDLLIRSKETITKQLQNNETPLMQFLISNLNRMLSDLQKDAATQQKINHWIRKLFQSCW